MRKRSSVPMSGLLLGLLVLSSPARANEHPPLRPLPAESLVAMPALLASGEVALIEANHDGSERQVTVIEYVAAPPALVRGVVADVEKYPQFLRNLNNRKVTRNADGSVEQDWALDLTLTSLEATFHHQYPQDGAILVEGVDPNDDSTYRWEFHQAAGGTVIALYGYTDVRHGPDVIKKILRASPTMESGLGLAVELVDVRSIKHRAEALAGKQPYVAPPQDPGFGFLLARGQVAVIRSRPSGRLADIAVLDRIAAPAAKVASTILAASDYHRFVEGITKSYETARGPAGLQFVTEFAIPPLSFETKYTMRTDGKSVVDTVGTEGDLRGARQVWNLSDIGGGKTLAVLRATQDLAAPSFVLRAVFAKEPLFEHGINVALGMVMLEGVKARAEGLK